MDFKYGSIWRKWDLHVHTPMSILYENYTLSEDEKDEFLKCIGNDFDNNEVKMYYFIKQLFNKAIQNNIAAIGITDYFFIDGYKFIKKIL